MSLVPTTGNRVAPLFDSVFSGIFDDVIGAPQVPATRSAPVDVLETPDGYVVEAEMPGYARDQVEVSVEGRRVAIRGKDVKKDESNGHDGKYIRREISSVSIERSVTLPQWANADGASAEMKDGILRVTVPKVEAARLKMLEVK